MSLDLEQNRKDRIQAFREDLHGIFDFWELMECLDEYSFNLGLKLSDLIFDGMLLALPAINIFPALFNCTLVFEDALPLVGFGKEVVPIFRVPIKPIVAVGSTSVDEWTKKYFDVVKEVLEKELSKD